MIVGVCGSVDACDFFIIINIISMMYGAAAQVVQSPRLLMAETKKKRKIRPKRVQTL